MVNCFLGVFYPTIRMNGKGYTDFFVHVRNMFSCKGIETHPRPMLSESFGQPLLFESDITSGDLDLCGGDDDGRHVVRVTKQPEPFDEVLLQRSALLPEAPRVANVST